jgi:tetratricopeptide (TPR) repeat protein
MSKDSPSQSGSVSYGDSAHGNITITGGVGGDVVFGDKHVHEAAVPTISAVHQLPPPPADFTGREAEITELLAALEDASLTISGLQGMGGVGKTALALKLAEMIKERYPDGQFYLDLLGVSPQPLTPAEALAHVIHSYHPGARLPESEPELRGIYLSVLHNQRALLLMDNARGESQVESLIPPAGCRLIVTSRQSFMLPGIFAKNLDCLPPADACKLLLTIAPRISELAGEIARLCGYLPLALRLAASAIATFRNLKPADYVQRLVGARKQLELVEASLSLSYEILSDEQQQRWRMLAVFPGSFDDAAAATVWEIEDEKAQDMLGELLAFSLVEWNEAARRFRLHDLARVFADFRMSETERDVGRRLHAQHYQAVLSSAKSLYLNGGDMTLHGLALFDLERVNIEAGHTWAVEQVGSDKTAAELCITYSNAGLQIFSLRQHPRELIRGAEAMLAAAIKMNLREMEGSALGNLGLAYATLGETRRAIDFFEQHLAIARKTGDRIGEGNALGNLGLAYSDLGEVRRAIKFHEQRVVIARETGDRRSEGPALSNLGLAYVALGETLRAIDLFEQALQIARETADRMSEGAVLGNLGSAYVALGEGRHAIKFYEQHLQIAREIGDRRGEGNALGGLGVAYRTMGEFRRASELFEQHLQIARETGDRRGEGVVLSNLGLAYAALGEIPRGIDLFEQALQIARETGNRWGEGFALSNLALAFDHLGHRAQAIDYAEASLIIFEQIKSPTAQKVRNTLVEWKANEAADQTQHWLMARLRNWFGRQKK